MTNKTAVEQAIDGLRDGLRQHLPIEIEEIEIFEREPGTYPEYHPDAVRLEVSCRTVGLLPDRPDVAGARFEGFVTLRSPHPVSGYGGVGYALGFHHGKDLAATFETAPLVAADPFGMVVRREA